MASNLRIKIQAQDELTPQLKEVIEQIEQLKESAKKADSDIKKLTAKKRFYASGDEKADIQAIDNLISELHKLKETQAQAGEIKGQKNKISSAVADEILARKKNLATIKEEIEAKEILAIVELKKANEVKRAQAKEAAELAKQEETQRKTSAELKKIKEKEANDYIQAINREIEAINRQKEAINQAKLASIQSIINTNRASAFNPTTTAQTNVKNENIINSLRLEREQRLSSISAMTDEIRQKNRLANVVTKETQLYLRNGTALKNENAIRNSSINGVVRHLRQIETLTIAMYSLYQVYNNTIGAGIELNRQIESQSLGVAALISANTRLKNGEVNLTKQFNIAVNMSTEIVKKLRKASVETVATFPELTEIFQQAIGGALGAGKAMGDTLEKQIDNTIILAKRMSNVAGSIGMPMIQVNEEIRSLVEGTITFNTRIARMLGITNEQVAKAKEVANGMVDLLNKYLAPFDKLSDFMTFDKILAKIKDSIHNILIDSTENIFGLVKEQLLQFNEYLIKNGDEIRKHLEGTMNSLYHVARAVKNVITTLYKFKDELSAIISLFALFKIGGMIQAGIIALGASFGKLIEKIKSLKKISALLLSNWVGIAGAAVAYVGYKLYEIYNKEADSLERVNKALKLQSDQMKLLSSQKLFDYSNDIQKQIEKEELHLQLMRDARTDIIAAENNPYLAEASDENIKKSEEKIKNLKEKLLQLTNAFTDSLTNNASKSVLQSISKNSKAVLKLIDKYGAISFNTDDLTKKLNERLIGIQQLKQTLNELPDNSVDRVVVNRAINNLTSEARETQEKLNEIEYTNVTKRLKIQEDYYKAVGDDEKLLAVKIEEIRQDLQSKRRKGLLDDRQFAKQLDAESKAEIEKFNKDKLDKQKKIDDEFKRRLNEKLRAQENYYKVIKDYDKLYEIYLKKLNTQSLDDYKKGYITKAQYTRLLKENEIVANKEKNDKIKQDNEKALKEEQDNLQKLAELYKMLGDPDGVRKALNDKYALGAKDFIEQAKKILNRPLTDKETKKVLEDFKKQAIKASDDLLKHSIDNFDKIKNSWADMVDSMAQNISDNLFDFITGKTRSLSAMFKKLGQEMFASFMSPIAKSFSGGISNIFSSMLGGGGSVASFASSYGLKLNNGVYSGIINGNKVEILSDGTVTSGSNIIGEALGIGGSVANIANYMSSSGGMSFADSIGGYFNGLGNTLSNYQYGIGSAITSGFNYAGAGLQGLGITGAQYGFANFGAGLGNGLTFSGAGLSGASAAGNSAAYTAGNAFGGAAVGGLVGMGVGSIGDKLAHTNTDAGKVGGMGGMMAGFAAGPIVGAVVGVLGALIGGQSGVEKLDDYGIGIDANQKFNQDTNFDNMYKELLEKNPNIKKELYDKKNDYYKMQQEGHWETVGGSDDGHKVWIKGKNDKDYGISDGEALGIYGYTQLSEKSWYGTHKHQPDIKDLDNEQKTQLEKAIHQVSFLLKDLNGGIVNLPARLYNKNTFYDEGLGGALIAGVTGKDYSKPLDFTSGKDGDIEYLWRKWADVAKEANKSVLQTLSEATAEYNGIVQNLKLNENTSPLKKAQEQSKYALDAFKTITYGLDGFNKDIKNINDISVKQFRETYENSIKNDFSRENMDNWNNLIQAYNTATQAQKAYENAIKEFNNLVTNVRVSLLGAFGEDSNMANYQGLILNFNNTKSAIKDWNLSLDETIDYLGKINTQDFMQQFLDEDTEAKKALIDSVVAYVNFTKNALNNLKSVYENYKNQFESITKQIKKLEADKQKESINNELTLLKAQKAMIDKIKSIVKDLDYKAYGAPQINTLYNQTLEQAKKDFEAGATNPQSFNDLSKVVNLRENEIKLSSTSLENYRYEVLKMADELKKIVPADIYETIDDQIKKANDKLKEIDKTLEEGFDEQIKALKEQLTTMTVNTAQILNSNSQLFGELGGKFTDSFNEIAKGFNELANKLPGITGGTTTPPVVNPVKPSPGGGSGSSTPSTSTNRVTANGATITSPRDEYVNSLYLSILGRSAEQYGLRYWADSNLSNTALAEALKKEEERQTGSTDPTKWREFEKNKGFKMFAQGGIINKPTKAIIGEAGYPEAIIPLKNGAGLKVDMGAGFDKLEQRLARLETIFNKVEKNTNETNMTLRGTSDGDHMYVKVVA